MAKAKRATVRIETTLIHETEKAWLFLIQDEEVWIPKSQGQWELHDDAESDGTLELNKWFAEKEGIKG